MNPQPDTPASLNLFLDVPIELSVELGSCRLPMREVLALQPGSIVKLDKSADAPIEIYANQKLIARGEVVVVEERFGVMITEMVDATP